MDPATLKTIALISWFALLFAAERLRSAARSPAKPGRTLKNIGLWAPAFLASPLFVLPLAAWADGHHLWTRPAFLSGAGGVLLSVLALDFWTYWVHRAYHENPVLWRLHGPHHFDEHLDTTSALRFHVGEVAVSALLRLIPIFALSIPLVHLVIYETLLTASSYFHHSN
ncbi:MAG: sterol desaturase family protein, partial [Pseudomonadota bacterium]